MISFFKNNFPIIADSKNRMMPVTPIQGPFFIKNDSVPVLPLYPYPKVQNGSFMAIPVSILIDEICNE